MGRRAARGRRAAEARAELTRQRAEAAEKEAKMRADLESQRAENARLKEALDALKGRRTRR